MNSAQIAQNIKKTAKSKKIALSTLLSDLNINKNLIYSMNTRGSMPALDTLNRIADYLEVSTEFLITGKEKSTTPGGAVLDLTPRQQDVATLVQNLTDDQAAAIARLIRQMLNK
nr:MAG TPA: repressor protein [Caudoviricetes sp.]